MSRLKLAASIGVIVTVGFAVIIYGEVGWCGDKKAPAKTEARILSPKDGSEVGKEQVFSVKARVSNVPKGFKIYTCTEINGLFWPKEALTQFRADEDWIATFVEGGNSPEFRLTLILVPPEGLKVLTKWFDTGTAKGDFPGLRLEKIKGAERLDSIKLKLR